MRWSARLIPCTARELVEAGSYKEDHRHADTFSWHRSGQDNLSPGGTGSNRQGARPEEVHSATATDVHREHADISDWLGGLFISSLPGPCLAEAGPRCAADRSSVREAVCEV